MQGPKKIQICGDNSEEVTPVPIPNTEVKLLSGEFGRPQKGVPLILVLWSSGKTPPFHGGNPGLDSR